MAVLSSYAVIHIDRFSDLSLVIGGHQVSVNPLMMMGEIVLVRFDGEEEIILRLEQSLRRIRHILSVAPAFEEGE